MINDLGGVRSLVVAALTLVAGAVQAQGASSAVQEQVGTEKAAAASQERINKLDDETQRMLNDFRLTVRETESLRRYNEALVLQIKSQEQEMVSIQNQIVEIERTNREIVPLMQEMVSTLDQIVKADLPFLLEERSKRIATLKELMTRADVSTAEKYRRILEAYQVEMEYGRTLEPYEGKLGTGDEAKSVDFLRIGRVALMYQTLDGDETGYWDHDKKEWVEDDDYEEAVRDGLRIARKQTAPDLLIAPIRAAKEIE